MNNGLYIGSFDMFTNGHLDILLQAVPLFDHIFVIIGKNDKKKRRFSLESSLQYIIDIVKRHNLDNKVTVLSSDKFAPIIAEKLNCSYIIRGLRNTSDYLFEEQIAKVYKAANKYLKLIYFYTNNAISSSMVKYLLDSGYDVSDYLSGDIDLLEIEK